MDTISIFSEDDQTMTPNMGLPPVLAMKRVSVLEAENWRQIIDQ